MEFCDSNLAPGGRMTALLFIGKLQYHFRPMSVFYGKQSRI
jgi:DUF1365 family protein